MKPSFEKLMTQYPSGMRVNALLAAKTFGVEQERIVVGNGAAEFIRSLMAGFAGKAGFVKQTFEEYPNRYDTEKTVVCVPTNADFAYTADDLIGFFSGKVLQALVLINLDNPSGNYIPKTDVEHLMAWAEDKDIRPVYDEIF